MHRNLILAALLCAGCATTKTVEAETGPQVSAETVKIEEAEQTISSLTSQVSVLLKNPGATAVGVERAKWEVVVAGKVVASGEQALSASVPATGEATVVVSAPFVIAKDDAEVAALVSRKEPIDYAVRGTLQLAGGGELEFAKADAIRAPRMPKLSMGSLDATTSPTLGVAVSVTVDLENPNTFPLLLKGSRWKLTLAGQPAGEGVMDRRSPKAASHTSYPIEVSIDPNDVKQRKELQGATVAYTLEAELDLGAAKVRLEQAGETRLLRAGD